MLQRGSGRPGARPEFRESGIVERSLAAERSSERDILASPGSLRLWACLLPTCGLGPTTTLRSTTWTGGTLAHRSPACVPACPACFARLTVS